MDWTASRKKSSIDSMCRVSVAHSSSCYITRYETGSPESVCVRLAILHVCLASSSTRRPQPYRSKYVAAYCPWDMQLLHTGNRASPRSRVDISPTDSASDLAFVESERTGWCQTGIAVAKSHVACAAAGPPCAVQRLREPHHPRGFVDKVDMSIRTCQW